MKYCKSQIMRLAPGLVLIMFLLGCASLLSEEVEVKGHVRLSDNPSTGNGGVNISTNSAGTISNSDGTFSLKKNILSDAEFILTFYKEGYEVATLECTVPYADGDDPAEGQPDEVLDVGTVTLQRITY